MIPILIVGLIFESGVNLILDEFELVHYIIGYNYCFILNNFEG